MSLSRTVRLNGGLAGRDGGFWAEQLQLCGSNVETFKIKLSAFAPFIPRRKRDWRVEVRSRKSCNYVVKGSRKLTESLRGCERGG